MLRKALIVIFSLGALVLGYFLYQSIAKPVSWRAEKEKRYSAIKKRLDDIRKAQVTYKMVKGNYAPNFAELIFFLDKTTLKRPKTVVLGGAPLNVGERIRTADSLYKTGYNVQLLRYVPFEDNVEFKITTRTDNGVEFIEIADPVPFDSNEPLSIGSLIEPTFKGSWEKEN